MHDFANQRKWCPTCERYVQYLQSATFSYCVCCDSKVRLYPEPVVPEYIHFPSDREVVEDIRRYTDA